MPGTPTFVVQVFEWRPGKLVAGPTTPALDAEDAVRIAATMAPLAPAVVALCLAVDDAGRAWSATVLATYGEVPEGWAESVVDG